MNSGCNDSGLPGKASLRQQLLAARRSLDAGQREAQTAAVNDRLIDLAADAQAVMVYLATPDELCIDGLINHLLDRGATVAAPRWRSTRQGGELGIMEPAVFASRRDLVRGTWGIFMPADDAPIAAELDLIIVPAVGMTRDGNRLGQGGGYYDRFLIQHPNARTITPVFDCQLVDVLPKDDHDQPVDVVVTADRE